MYFLPLLESIAWEKEVLDSMYWLCNKVYRHNEPIQSLQEEYNLTYPHTFMYNYPIIIIGLYIIG